METALGRYEVRATIASGPRSTVYEGWDSGINRRVAIKKVALSEAAQQEGWQHLARFRREAQAAARLQHPNLVAIFDYGETTEYAYIVMEFVEGATLEAALSRGERFATAAVSRLMEDILNGLQYCHDRGVVHRDIKPSNVMVTRDGHAKIADFGLARIEDSNLTQIGTIMGTPAYMSPEQFRGETTDARTDIYSAGVILYQLLTGERPFEGGLATIMHKALNTVPPKPSELSGTARPALDAVVARAMAKRPDQRFQTPKEFADALRAAFTSRAAAASNPAPGELSRPRPLASVSARPRPYVMAAVGALVIAAAGATLAVAYRPWAPRIASSPAAALTAHEPSRNSKPIVEEAKKEEPMQGAASSTGASSAPPIDSAYRQPDYSPPAEQADVTNALRSPDAASFPTEGSLPPTSVPNLPPPQPSLSPTTASLDPHAALTSTLKEPTNPPRVEPRAPGPRMSKKAPAPLALDAPTPRRLKGGGAEDAALVSSAAGGQGKDATNAPHAPDQEAKPTPKIFGRYEIQNGVRVFVPSSP